MATSKQISEKENSHNEDLGSLLKQVEEVENFEDINSILEKVPRENFNKFEEITKNQGFKNTAELLLMHKLYSDE